MKSYEKLAVLFCSFLLISCEQNDNTSNNTSKGEIERETNDSIVIKDSFYNVNSKGVLLGETIKLMNKNCTDIMDISYLNQHFVDIVQVSENYYKNKAVDDYCQDFKLVKIKAQNLEGYIDGKNLFEPVKSEQNRIVIIDKNEVSIIATKNFGISVSDEDGLTFCSINTPIIFSDKLEKYEGLVEIVKNEHSSDDFPYFELKNDDYAIDEIVEIKRINDEYIMTIRRTYQEGEAILFVAIFKNKNGSFIAEIRGEKLIEE